LKLIYRHFIHLKAALLQALGAATFDFFHPCSRPLAEIDHLLVVRR